MLGIILAIIIAGVIFAFWINNKAKIQESKVVLEDNEEIKEVRNITTYSEEDRQIGEFAKISSAEITKRQTGTGPWDGDNNPGNDMDENNNIVRSFDQVTWTIENTMVLKSGGLEEHYKGGVIEIKAELPETCKDVMTWDLDSMKWAENAQVTENGTILTAQYSLSKDEVTIPGKQTLVLVLKVNHAQNNTQIKPEFTVNLYGNNNEEKINIHDEDAVTVSAAASYNVKIGRNTLLNRKGYYDFVTNTETDSLNGNSVFGRMQGYGITLQLYNSNASKGLKGIEFPEGDISFDIKFSEFINSNDVSTQDNYKPTLWDYKESNGKNQGKLNRNLYWDEDNYSRYPSYVAPLNSGNSDDSCYNGGTWNIEQDDTVPTLYHVTVSNYKFDTNNFHFPIRNAVDVVTTKRYGSNIGCFSAGYFEVIMQMPEVAGDVTSIYMRAQVSNFKANSISGESTTDDKNSGDNYLNDSITLYPPGSYSKEQILINKSSQAGTINYNSNYNLSPSKSGGDVYLNRGDTFIISSELHVDINNDNVAKSMNILQKFDDKAIRPIDGSNSNSGLLFVTRKSK